MAEFFRFEDYGRVNDGIDIYLRRVPVLKATPKGNWIDDHGHHRFVLTDASKRWACPTVEEAWTSFQKRKARHLAILTGQHNHVAAIHAAITGKSYAEIADASGTVRIMLDVFTFGGPDL